MRQLSLTVSRLSEATSDAAVVDNCLDTLHRLINDMLSLSKLREGHLAIVPAPTDLRRVILSIASDH